jgi:UDP-N-acetylglucosamine 2-epimerase
MRKKNIFIFTATRAEYGLLRWIIKKLQNTAEFNAYVIVGGTYLSKDYGDTLDEILADNIRNILNIRMLKIAPALLKDRKFNLSR